MEEGLTIKEANRLSVMRQVDKKLITLRRAAVELGLSERQVKRIRRRYLLEGEIGLASKHRGKASTNRIEDRLRREIVKIIGREEYHGFGPTLMKEKLQQRHGHDVSNETLRKWMINEGLWQAKTKSTKKVHMRRRRRSRFGELLQGDGSRHAWFENRGEECTLVLFVDDATSQITAGKFVKSETIVAYQEILEEHLKKYGRPLGLYVDKHSIFKTSKEREGAKEPETHFGRVLRELGIELICAHSPQAKGRVERANGTLQDRLIKEMRLKGINTIEEANAFLPEFIRDYNKRFGKAAAEAEDAHRKLRKEDRLETIFARRTVRKLSKSLCFSYQGVSYQLQPKSPNRFRSTHVLIMELEGKPMWVESEGQACSFTRLDELEYKSPKVLDSKEIEALWPSRQKKPARNHPWN